MQQTLNVSAGSHHSELTSSTNAGKGRTYGIRSLVMTTVLLLVLSVLTSPAVAQVSFTGVPRARVTARIDNGDRSVLSGHVPPPVRAAADLGRVAGEGAMNHLVMVLRPTVEQDHALKTLLDQQLDKTSKSYHRWLTPDEFGAQFGVADSDIARVTEWLEQSGFTVEHVAASKRFIQFSGSVEQVESAFRTEMHSYDVKGTVHISNNSDISVPSALRAVIAGVPTLNNFFKKADFQKGATVAERRAQAVHTRLTVTPDSTNPFLGKFYFIDPFQGLFSAPEYTSGATHFVGAGDFATIYNTTPLLSGGFDGTGVSIGVIGRTDIHLADVQIYRHMFGLKVNDPTFIIAGEDPGVVGGDDGESYLDVEVSGGAAPGAAVKFITSRASLTTDGVDLSAMYAVENNLTDIISESYGQCEANFSAAAISFYANLWGQAAAQGQTVFVSSGDNGPAGCDSSNNTFSGFGYAVSGLASTAFNVAVGGTIFADTAANWNATATTAPPFSSALGYIPEKPWNEAKASGATGASGLWSGSGGISAYFATPPWQRGFGVPLADPPYPNKPTFTDPPSPFVPGPHRYMPDVSMAAAAQHDGTLYCAEGICQLSATQSLVNAGIVGGTSVAAPTMAGVQALVNQVNGGRQGMANYVYYALADAQHTAGLVCDASSASLDVNCAFRDITTGNTLVCTDSLTSTTCTTANKIGWTAVAGYDMATGLGSPNAQKLANLWSTVTFRSSTTTMNAVPATGTTHGQSVTVSGTVAPGSGLGTPTGNVAFIPSSGSLGDPMNPNTGAFLNPPPLATLDGSGNYTIPLTSLPAGTYTLVARYGGDGTFAASTSTPVTITVSAETATVTIAPNAFNGTTCIETPATTFTYGSYIWTDVTVAGASGQGVPTGTVSVTDNGNPLVTTTLNANGAGHLLSGLVPTTSCVFGYTFQDTPSFPAGSHLLAATYSGDSTFNSATATPVTIIINQATTTGVLTTGSTNIASGSPVQLTFTVAGLSAASPGTLTPTGTVTFTDTTTAAVVGTALLSPTVTLGGRAILTTSAITTAGANSITASWPGDANYTGITSAAVTVTVQAGTATSVAVTSNLQPAVLGGRPTWTATMTPTTVTAGTANFFDGNVLLGTGTVGAAHTATFRPAATVNLPVGVHNITVSYAGNATFNSSMSPIFAQTFTQAATTTNLTVKINGSWGQTYVLNATLGTTQTATPVSGTVQFSDGGNPIGASQPFTTVTAAFGGFGLYQGTLPATFSVGTHVLTAQLTDANYTSPVSNSQTITVAQATPVMTSAGGTFTYNGAPHGGSGTAVGGAGESLAVTISYTGTGATTYGPSSTPPTNAGTYSVVAHTAGDANNAANDSSAAALTINKANSIVTATGGSFLFDGNPHPGSGSATGGAGESLTVTLSYSGTGATVYGPSATAPTNSGTYLVTAHTPGDANNNAGDSTPVALNITTGTPTITPGGPTTFCAGGSVTLTSSSASGNQWYLNGNPIGGATNQSYVATASGNYTVIVTISGNPSAPSAATTVTVNPLPATPTITPGGPTTFCAGGSVTLTSSSASGNQWSLNGNPIGGATNQTFVASSSGNYTVVVTTSGCSSASSAATTVTVNPIPATPTITPGGPTTFCTGGSVTLTSSAASGNQWFLNGNPIGGATNQAYSATASGNYTVVVTTSGCSSAASAATTVTVNPIPATPTITPGGPTTFCTGGSVTLTSSAASGNQWFLNGNPIGGATNQAYSATASGNYTVAVTTSGCSSTPSAATTVTVNPIPATPTITGNASFCTGGNTTLTSSSASGNQWSLNGNPIGGATNQMYVATAAGSYTVTVTASGCSSAASAAKVVTVNPNPDATITTPAVVVTGSTGNIASVASAGVGASYTWGITGGTITAGTGTSSITFTAGAVGTLTLNVTVTTGAGCIDAKSATVTVTSPSVTVTSVSPTGGTIAGGSAVTINGTGFLSGAGVTFGGSAATNVVVVSAIKITARTPAHALGSVNVTVTNTNSSTGTLTNGYLYKAQQFDPNNDSTISAMDIFYLINYLYMGGPAPAGPGGMLSGDANGDGVVNPLDIFYLINYLFLGGPRPNAVTPHVITEAVGAERQQIEGSIVLGKAVLRDGRYVVPVIMTTQAGSAAPQAMSLRVHFDSEVGKVTIAKAGAAKDLNVAFETNNRSGNDLSYLVSYGNLTLGTSHSAVVAEIEIEAGNNAALRIDPTLTMLSDQTGSMSATVANGKLQVNGTTIGSGATPRPRTPGREVN